MAGRMMSSIVAPPPPTAVTATVSAAEYGEQVLVRFLVSWVPASKTARLITLPVVDEPPTDS
jgi:hypothetical protein